MCFLVVILAAYTSSPSYNNKVHPHLPKLSALLSGLSGKIPQPKVVVASILGGSECPGWENDWIKWDDFVTDGKQRQFGRTESGEIEWKRLPFDTPLWILFSSGTTGRPKSVPHVRHFLRPFSRI